MKETLRLILTLTVTAALTGAFLALANMLTEQPIAEARRAELIASLRIVLPEHDNEPDRDKVVIEVNGRRQAFYPARRGDRFAGAAFTHTADGYGGAITVMIGVDAADRIHAIHILNHLETPGLGANIARPEFTRQFRQTADRPASGIALTRDGGAIQAVTAATVSSEAVVRAVNDGLALYIEHKHKVMDNQPIEKLLQ